MPHRLREARKLAGFVATVPVQRRAELWFADPVCPSAPDVPVGGSDVGLPTEIDGALSEPDHAIASWVGPDRADEAGGEGAAAPGLAEPDAGVQILAADDAPAAEDGIGDPARDGMAEPCMADAVPASDFAAAEPAAEDGIDAGDPAMLAAVGPDEALAASPSDEPDPSAPETAPLPDWRTAGMRDGGGTQGEDFLAAIRSVLNDATRYDSQMSAALIDLHLDLVICANGQRQAVAEAAEEVRHASIGLFTALYRDGLAETERVMATVATDRLEASLAA